MPPAGAAGVPKVTVALKITLAIKITLAFRVEPSFDVTTSPGRVEPWGRPPLRLLFATTSPLHVR